METKNCAECNKEFTGRNGKRFCSGSCRARYSIKNSGTTQSGGLGSLSAPAPAKVPGSFDAASQFIISELTRKRDKLETQLTESQKKNETLKAKLEETEKAFEKYKNDKILEETVNAKPGGLGGFLESTTGQKLIEVAGPILAEKLGALLTPAQPQISGNDQVAMFGQWFNQLAPALQEEVWALLMRLSSLNEVELNQMLAYLLQAGVYQKAS